MEIGDWVGYLGSGLVILSFLLKDLRSVRAVNLLGCLAFIVYGILKGNLWPVILPNTLIAGIQVYYLLKK